MASARRHRSDLAWSLHARKENGAASARSRALPLAPFMSRR